MSEVLDIADIETQQNAVVENTEAQEKAQSNEQENAEAQKVEESKQTNLTDDAVLAYLKDRNIEINSIEDLKPKIEPTEKEISEQNNKKDKALLDRFMKRGGTIEDFTNIKSIANADLKEFSYNNKVSEVVAQLGVSKVKAEEILKNQYFQYTDEELEYMDDEAREEALLLKEKFSEQLYNSGTQEQNKAKNLLSYLEKEIEEEKVEAKVEESILEEVKLSEINFKSERSILMDEIEGLPFKLGEINVSIPKEAIQEAAEILKDPQKRNQFLYHATNGAEKVTELHELLAIQKSLPIIVNSAVKIALQKQSQEFTKFLPKDTASLVPTRQSEMGNGEKRPGTVTGFATRKVAQTV